MGDSKNSEGERESLVCRWDILEYLTMFVQSEKFKEKQICADMFWHL